MDFSLVDHLISNYSPIMTVAFPRGAYEASACTSTSRWTPRRTGTSSCAAPPSWESPPSARSRASTAGGCTRVRPRARCTPRPSGRLPVTGCSRPSRTVLLLSPEETRRLVASLQRARRGVDLGEPQGASSSRRRSTRSSSAWRRSRSPTTGPWRTPSCCPSVSRPARSGSRRCARRCASGTPATSRCCARRTSCWPSDRTRPSGSIVDLPPKELKALVKRLRTEPAKRSWGRRGR